VRHRNRVHVIGVAALLAALFAGTGRGASGDAGGNIAVALLSERVAVEPGRPFYVGLQMKMRRGWHTYWKNPGDSGMPLRIAWNLPDGFSAGSIEWPTPERIHESTLMSYGYSREVLIPIEITPPERLAADSVTLAGTFEWLECKDVCVPGSAVLRLSMPVRSGSGKVGPAARLFARARSQMPKSPAGWSFSAEAGPRAIALAMRAPPGISPRGGYLFVDRPLVVDYAVPQGFEGTEDGYRLTVPPAPNASGTLDRLTGVLVVEGGAGSKSRTSVQVDVPVRPGDPAPSPVPPARAPLPAAPNVALFALTGLGLVLLLAGATRSRRKKAHLNFSGE
jgi:thiol:disulfide interchange protein DsbD